LAVFKNNLHEVCENHFLYQNIILYQEYELHIVIIFTHCYKLKYSHPVSYKYITYKYKAT